MELSPHLARTIAFRTVRKGYDPAEVDAFREQAASAIENAQNQATAMEARARAAIAKLQEATQAAAERPAAAAVAPAPAAEPAAAPDRGATPERPPAREVAATANDAETISRTLLLAQRTAENTVAEAKSSAESIVSEARATAAAEIHEARSETTRLIDEAKAEARRQAESERVAAENEVQALLARREFLLSDVEYLEQHIAAQRQRVKGAADSLLDIVERQPSGLAEARRPLLSASADPEPTPAGDRGPAATPPGWDGNGTMPDEEVAVDHGAPGQGGGELLEPTPVHQEALLEFGDEDSTEH